MNTRLALLIKELHITQKEFAKKIHLSPTTITAYMKGRIALTERTIDTICKTYNVNENWLRTGEGDMFVIIENTLLINIQEKYELSDLELSIVEKYLKLAPNERMNLAQHVYNLANNS